MDFLTQFFASLFDRFKISNPKVAAFVLFILSVMVFTTNQGVVFGLFAAPEWLVGVTKALAAFLLAVTGSRTARYLPESAI